MANASFQPDDFAAFCEGEWDGFISLAPER